MTWMETAIHDTVKVSRKHGSVLAPACLAIVQLQTWFIWVPIPGLSAVFSFLVCVLGIISALVRRRSLNVEFWCVYFP
jgi:hypothetical protein